MKRICISARTQKVALGVLALAAVAMAAAQAPDAARYVKFESM